MPKIYPISGSHGTGKSTIISELSCKLHSFRVGFEIPREVCKKLAKPDFYVRGNNTFAKQIHLLFEQVAAEVLVEKDSVPVIWDRSVLDHYAYTTYCFRNELDASELAPVIEARLAELASRYGKIFYVPVEIPLVGDDVREADLTFQKGIDAEIVGLLRRFRPDYVTLSGTIQTRCSVLLAALPHELFSGQ